MSGPRSTDATIAILELVNSLIHASGLRSVALSVTDADVDDEDEVLEAIITDAACERMVELARDAGTYLEPYPLADKKVGKKHRQGLNGMWRNLIDKIKHEVAYDNILLPWCIEWLCIMCSSAHRGLRHTGTEVAMTLMTRLTELLIEVEAEAVAKERQQAYRGSKKEGSGMAALVQEEVERLKAQATALQELLQTVFKGVFIERYRDSCEDIRVCCLIGLGRAMGLHHGVFLHDTYLKYLGWMLNNTSAHVRATAVSQLHHVYKTHGTAHTQRLHNFTQRFEARLVEMTRDIDIKVSVEAIKVINTLYELDLLSNKRKAVQDAMQVMRFNEVSQLKALVPLVNKHMSRAFDDGAEPATAKAKKKGKQSPASTAQVDEPLVQLAKLAWGSAEGIERLPEVCGRIVDSMGAMTPALSDWSAYCDLLTSETLDDDQPHLQCVLLYLMAASAAHLNESIAESAHAAKNSTGVGEVQTPRRKKARRAPTRKDVEAQEEGLTALSSELGRSLAPLLEKFGAQSDVLQPLLSLVSQIKLQSASSALKGDGFALILEQMDSIVFKHNDARALRACASAWASLLVQTGAPAFQEQARVRFKKLTNKLMVSLKPLEAYAKRPKGSFDFDESSVALRRIAYLVSAYPESYASMKTLDKMSEPLLSLLDSQTVSTRGLRVGIIALLQLKTTILTSQVAEARSFEGQAQNAEVELHETTSRLRDEVLSLLTRTLLVPVASVAEAAASSLCLLLGTVLPRGSEASENDEAKDALLCWFDTALQRAAGSLEDEEEEDVRPASDLEALSGPHWLRDVVSCGLLRGIPMASVLCSLLSRLEDLPYDFEVFVKHPWTNHMMDSHSVQALAMLEEQILKEAFNKCDGKDAGPLDSVAEQLSRLHAALAKSNRWKDRVGELTHVLLDGTLGRSLSDGGECAKIVEVGLLPLLPFCSREHLAQLYAKFGSKLSGSAQFARGLRASFSTREGRDKSPARRSVSQEGSLVAARNRRGHKRRMHAEANDPDNEVDDEEESAEEEGHDDEHVDREEEEEEEPWDGEGVDDMETEEGAGGSDEDAGEEDEEETGEDDPEEHAPSLSPVAPPPAYAYSRVPRRRA